MHIRLASHPASSSMGNSPVAAYDWAHAQSRNRPTSDELTFVNLPLCWCRGGFVLRFFLRRRASERVEHAGDAGAYRLRRWPPLSERVRTARVLQALTRMSSSPVSRGWFATHSGMNAQEADRLLDELLTRGFVERVDTSAFAGESRA